MSEFSRPSDSRRAFFCPDLPKPFSGFLGGVIGPARIWLCQALGPRGVAVVPTGSDLARFRLDAETFGLGIEVLPPAGGAVGSPEAWQQRRIQARLTEDDPFWVVCLPEALEIEWATRADPVLWRPGDSGPSYADLQRWIESEQLDVVDRVEHPGEASVRGGLIDAWWPGEEFPWRFDFFGDELESIHDFDVISQRRGPSRDVVGWCPGSSEQHSWLQSMPAATPLVGFDHEVKEDSAPQMVPILASSFGELRWNTTTTDSLQGKFVDRVGRLQTLASTGQVHVFFETEAGRERFFEEAPQLKNLPGLEPHLGRLSEGIKFNDSVFLNAHVVFGKTPVRRQLPFGSRDPESRLLSDLSNGDLVVHVHHGIARFKGMKMLDREGVSSEFMALEFADRAWLYVPATQMDLVQRYVGSGPTKPHLSKLGGKRWQQQKDKVTEAVDELALELLEVQASRRAAPGISFPELDEFQLQFAALFPHEETADQLRVLEEIETDMVRSSPMDRLLCGDVGYGKTEIAMRAAFKAVCGGKQVCLMAPTTVLVEQHVRTFRQRFADFPVRVERLSRLTPGKEARRILEGLQTGEVDIVIGTHRLLGSAVEFLNLGLVVIDEEQRFGVKHKEALKRWRVGVDVLTLTATPIPRTLHMALLGLRDISNITTPPVDRQSVSTRVVQPGEGLLAESLKREFNRGGQSFLLHNRVKSLKARARQIENHLPDARVVWAHGQMPPRELEEVMLRMVSHEIDVLVCTTIISNGVDIPNVNTIFVDDAQRFGLAELHQLRGRVGRADRKGYCWLFLPSHGKLGESAKRRLQAMEEYADLGAGFQIAMRDLEIRGAGNILGAEQSGHIMAIGYELYCQLLEEAVQRRRGEDRRPRPDRVSVDLPVPAFLPEDWTGSRREKVTALRRLLGEVDVPGINKLAEEFADRFGRLPDPFNNLLNVLRLKALLAPLGVGAVGRGHEGIFLKADKLEAVVRALHKFPGKLRPEPDGRVWLQPYDRGLDPVALVEELVRVLGVQSGNGNQAGGFNP